MKVTFSYMKGIVLVFCQLLLCSLFAGENISLLFEPYDQDYKLSVAAENESLSWKTAFSLEKEKGMDVKLPIEANFSFGPLLFSFGKSGPGPVGNLYALVDNFPVLRVSKGNLVCAVTNPLFDAQSPKTLEFSFLGTSTSFSLFQWAWGERKDESENQYLVDWSAQQAAGGWGGNFSLDGNIAQLYAEVLYTPVSGIKAYSRQSLNFPLGRITLNFGNETYPKSYRVDLFYNSLHTEARYSFEDGFGQSPVFGGEYQIRKTRFESSLRRNLGCYLYQISSYCEILFLSDGFIQTTHDFQFQFRHTANMYPMELTYRLKGKRNSSEGMAFVFKPELSVQVSSLQVIFFETGMNVTLSWEIALGEGSVGFKLIKAQGKRNSLKITYSTTIGQ
jgi:hypothetical protein